MYDVDYEELEQRIDSDLMISDLKNNLSSEGSQYISVILGYIEHIENFGDFARQLELLESDIKKNRNGKEIDILLTICSVCKNSAYFWLPEENGGSAEGYEIITKFAEANSIGREKTLKAVVTSALIGDGFSAGAGMLGVAVAGIMGGPIGWAALAIVFGESVLSSGFTAYLEWGA